MKHKTARFFSALLSLALLLTLLPPAALAAGEEKPAESIEVDQTELSIDKGQEATLTATVEPADTTVKEITWKLSATGRVSFSGANASDDTITTPITNGTASVTLKANNNGPVTVTATAGEGGPSASCEVMVPIHAEGLKLYQGKTVIASSGQGTGKPFELFAGTSVTFSAEVTPEGAINPKVKWKSSNTSAVTVKPSGSSGETCEITASSDIYAVGQEVKITVETEELKDDKTPRAQIIFTIKVLPSTSVEEVTLRPASCDIAKGSANSRKLSAAIIPSDATDKALKWSSSDENIAVVDIEGNVTGISPGKATITATSSNGVKSNACEVTVSGVTLPDYPGSGDPVLRPNATAILRPVTFGAASSVSSWSWKTDDNSIVRVVSSSAGGVLTGIGEGTTRVTCASDDGKYSASCNVTVARKLPNTIKASLDDGLLRFSSITSSFSNFSYLSGLTVSPAQGTLYHGYVSNDNPGSGVASSDRYYRTGGNPNQISDVVFVPKTDFDGDAIIRFSGYSASGAATSGEIVVPVQSDEASLDYSVQAGGVLRFPTSDFNDYCTTLTGKGLSYVTFTLPSSRYGKLYYNYTDADIYERAVASGDRFYRSGSPSLAGVALVADTGYQGVFELSFTGYDTSGKSFSGSARITVGDGGVSTGNGDINYSVAPGRRVDFNEDDFDDLCRDLNDRGLDYIRFTSLPSSSQGVLYCGGSKVSTSSRYDYDDDLEDVYFRADEDYDGTVSIPFTGYDTRGSSFRGTVEIEVYDGGSGSSGDLVYSVDPGRRVYFNEEDFNDYCNEERDRDLNYIRFTSLPSSSRGVLYYDKDVKVSTGTNYYYDGSSRRLIEDLSFVADGDYGGTAYLSFTGYDERGGSFKGTVEVRIGWDEGDTDISYTTRPGSRVAFQKKDFSDASYSAADRQLNYVRFTSLPSSSRGTLYYDGDTYVRTGTSYYYSGSNRLLEDVSFVPASSFTGTVTIPYTGQSVNGRTFYGEVQITVSGVSPVNPSGSSAISYSTTGRAVTFKRSDFAQACAGTLPTGPATVRLSAPDSSVGSLYLNYASPSQYRTFVSGQSYSATELDQLSFVPKAGFRGTAAVAVTLYDAKGSAWGGVVSIDVTPSTSSDYFRDMGSARWAVPAADFLRRYGVVSGVSASSYGPGLPMRRGDFVLMLNNAFSFPESLDGSFPDVPRDAYYAPAIAAAKAQDIVYSDSDGNFRPGSTVTRLDAAILLYRCLQRRDGISPGSAGDLARFSDAGSIPGWAVEAMGALVRRGVFTGDDAGRLNPGSPLTRAEMAVILYQAIT